MKARVLFFLSLWLGSSASAAQTMLQVANATGETIGVQILSGLGSPYGAGVTITLDAGGSISYPLESDYLIDWMDAAFQNSAGTTAGVYPGESIRVIESWDGISATRTEEVIDPDPEDEPSGSPEWFSWIHFLVGWAGAWTIVGPIFCYRLAKKSAQDALE